MMSMIRLVLVRFYEHGCCIEDKEEYCIGDWRQGTAAKTIVLANHLFVMIRLSILGFV